MKIAFIVQDLVGQGMQYATAAVIRGFVERGISVDLLVSPVHQDKATNGGQIPFQIPKEVNWIWMPSRHARKNVYFIRRYIAHTDADAVISTSGPYHWGLRLARIALLHPPKIVSMCHGNFGWNEQLGRKWNVGRKYSWRWLKMQWFYWGFDRVFFVNETVRRLFSQLVPTFDFNHTLTVYNPCIDEVFQEKVQKDPSHPWLKEKLCPTFVAAGAYQDCKDHLTLIKAFHKVSQTKRVRLVVFGTGPLQKNYLDYITEHRLQDVISVPGYANCLPAEIRAADCFICSSKWESFSIVLVEALAAGTPVITTDAPWGPREVVANGRYGRLVPVGDIEKMAEAVLQEINTPQKKPTCESWMRFSCASCVDRFLHGLSECLDCSNE